MLPVSLECPFLIAPSVFSKVYIQQWMYKNPLLTKVSCYLLFSLIRKWTISFQFRWNRNFDKSHWCAWQMMHIYIYTWRKYDEALWNLYCLFTIYSYWCNIAEVIFQFLNFVDLSVLCTDLQENDAIFYVYKLIKILDVYCIFLVVHGDVLTSKEKNIKIL